MKAAFRQKPLLAERKEKKEFIRVSEFRSYGFGLVHTMD